MPNRFTYFVLLFFYLAAAAQQKSIGVEFGYGNTSVKADKGPELIFTSKSQSFFLHCGLSFRYSPSNSIFDIKTGLLYDRRSRKEAQFNYFRVPLGVDLKFGKELKFIVGGGAYASVLLADKGLDNYTNYKSTRQTFQPGVYADCGAGMTFGAENRSAVHVLFQFNRDLGQMFLEYKSSGPGAVSSSRVRGADYFIRVEFTRQIGK